MSAADYELLYKRFLARDSYELLEMANLQRYGTLLDLCTGPTARASICAINRIGAGLVVAVDESPRMLGPFPVANIRDGGYFNPHRATVHQYLKHAVIETQRFDAVVCQQGINYWFNQDDLLRLSYIINPEGVFVFNTFNKRPVEEAPIIKKYEIDNNKYIEHSIMFGKTIFHTQIIENVIQHSTHFEWIEPNEFKTVLKRCFKYVDIQTCKSTDIYICRNGK
jgi:ubiquinone/menaquinone biosynthesis C-methylase UbiE